MNDKICAKCGEAKDVSRFRPRSMVCRDCTRARERERHAKKWASPEYRDRQKAKQAERRKQRKLEAVSLFGDKCHDCEGTYHPSVYDFHHLDPSVKEKHPSVALSRLDWKEELEKCVMLCANCHRIRHHGGEDESID